MDERGMEEGRKDSEGEGWGIEKKVRLIVFFGIIFMLIL
jgi:hypothetical protein